MARYCPSCGVVLTSTEYSQGECSECGATFPSERTTTAPAGQRITPLQPIASTPGPISPPRPSPVGKLLATVLFLLTIGSFFLPWGMFRSIWDGFSKGGEICAHAGCHEPSTEFVKYGDGFSVAETVGYCKDHQHEAPKDFTITQGKSFSILLAMVFVIGPGLYLLWFLVSLLSVYREEPGALSVFFLYVAGGLILLNALSYGYWHYCHFAFRHSGW